MRITVSLLLLLAIFSGICGAEEPGTVTMAPYRFQKIANGWKLYIENTKQQAVKAVIQLDKTKVRLLTGIRDLTAQKQIAWALTFTVTLELQPAEKKILLITAEPFEWEMEQYYEF